MNPKVLLADTTRWPSAARLAIRLRKVGCQVSAVTPSYHPVFKTRAIQRHYVYNGLCPVRSLMAAIEADCPDLVIPCDDRAVYHLHELYGHNRGAIQDDRIRALIRRSLGDPLSYPVVSSRHGLIQTAREEGICAPATALIVKEDDLDSWHGKHEPPWVIKVDGDSGGRNVRVVSTIEEAKHVFKELSKPLEAARVIKWFVVDRDSFWLRPWWHGTRPVISIQTYVEGRPANCAVLSWEGQVLAGIGVTVLQSNTSTGPAIAVQVVDNPDMMMSAQRIANRFGVSGFFGLDFMIERSTHKAYLIEMNPRCTQLCHLQLGPGRDMVGALWSKLTGRPCPETIPVTKTDVISYFPRAIQCRSPYLESSYHDIPQDEPELIQDLLHPWPDRSFVFKAYKILFSEPKR